MMATTAPALPEAETYDPLAQARWYFDIARAYRKVAETFPDDSLGYALNMSEAATYDSHGSAVLARSGLSERQRMEQIQL